jgi:diguanylate cyclase (GGDEF)-like protein
MVKYIFPFLFLLITLIAEQPARATGNSPSILILNSYHKGYSWSDELVDSIISQLYHQFPQADITLEYMDTKRNSSTSYIDNLFNLYQEKYGTEKFDLLVATDDNAIIHAIKNHQTLYKGVPLVFCGANNIDPLSIDQSGKITGVREYSDILGTIRLAMALQPEAQKIVVVNDTTITGRKVMEELTSILHLLPAEIEVTFLEDLPLIQLEEKVQDLPADAFVLLLAYLRDNSGKFYSPDQTASTLSRASSVPIYSVWDFFFRHGIVGGVLTSGFHHGEEAGKMGVQILLGAEPQDIALSDDGGNLTLIDHAQMVRFGLRAQDLPETAIVKNITYQEQKNILILFSYSLDDQWTYSIYQGLQRTLDDSGDDITTFVEFMDTKRYTDKAYIHQLASVYQKKYRRENIDLIVTADDNAFNFATRYREMLFAGSPIVFCGVNYLENNEELPEKGITGIMESYDITGTISLGVSLFPATDTIFVINDTTTTGLANLKKLKESIPQIPETLKIVESGNRSMQEILNHVENLEDNTLILLMSFTKDRNGDHFSYQNSIELIHQRANRPILGFWDFYTGRGLAAGVITRGFDQGRMAAEYSLKIVGGADISEMPIVLNSPVQPVVDYRELQRFESSSIDLPTEVTVLNRPYSFIERNKRIAYATITVLLLLFLLVILQALKIVYQKKKEKRLAVQAETDDLTGTKTRNYLLDYLRTAIPSCQREKIPLALCFFDLDNLKTVNDSYGHNQGDLFILHAVSAIKKNIRSEDILCRVGGDEFIAALGGCEKTKVTTLCTDINADLFRIKEMEDLPFDMSISCGISFLDLEIPQDPEFFVETADREMYDNKQAKRKGITP